VTHLLHLDSSARRAGSTSRQLGRDLVLGWCRRDPATTLTYRDLDAEPLSFVNDSWVSAAFTPPEQHDHELAFSLARSEQLIGELEAADVLVIGAPMYNLGIPAALKAWIDQVVRVGRTFGYDGPQPVGLVHGKRAVIIATSGGNAPRYEEAGMDFRTSYLRTILGFIGIVDVDVVQLSDTMAGEPDLAAAGAQVDALLDRLVLTSLVGAQRS
jgi:FMN-dependent NADH-azoreductase